MTPEKQEELRTELSRLRKRRDDLIADLGAYAQENSDLRENSAYLHTEQKIHLLDAQIADILAEFGKLALKQKRVAYLKKSKSQTI
ncbi:hypothetical protein KJ605_02135 [Patescibacteria group bacterium]|nr:hypothetical protein [Patescibacteria group bacterium]MBU1970551.1 hypothetical protein [Patescibacteria group bacterium]